MLQKIVLLLIAMVLLSCDNDPKNYAIFSGKITNHIGNDGFVTSKNFKKKTIKISKEGMFLDTLYLTNKGELLTFSDGNEFTRIYLKNGDNIHLTLDTKEFDETLKFTGEGADNNNYLAQKSLFSENLLPNNVFDMSAKEFEAALKEMTKKSEAFLEKAKHLDSNLIQLEKENLTNTEELLMKQFKMMKEEKAAFSSFVGKPSPDFVNYENFKGGQTSLKDLKGKYVYIDVWATWCAPCKGEIPFLKKLESEFHDKNIAFVSISVDNGRGYQDNSLELSKEGWKTMIKEKAMGGIQLFADKAWKSDFIRAYKINGIPRFILIDPKGHVIDANASRPSSPKTRELFNTLLN